MAEWLDERHADLMSGRVNIDGVFGYLDKFRYAASIMELGVC